MNYFKKILVGKFLENPIIIIGHGRSGTTALQKALMQHQQIVGTEFESPMIFRFAFLNSLFHFQDNSKNEYYQVSTQIKEKYFNFYLKKLIFESVFGYNFGFKRFRWLLRKKHIKFLNIKFWVAKSFPNMNEAKSLQKIFPNIKYIYIYRNAIDVINSAQKTMWFKEKDFTELCKSWAHSVNKYEYLMNYPYSLCIKQDDLVSDPQKTLKDIQKFLNLNYSEIPSDFIKNNIIHPLDNLDTIKTKNTKYYFQKREPAFLNWSENQKNIFKKYCKESMLKLNYTVPF